jgi:hypothetical protein
MSIGDSIRPAFGRLTDEGKYVLTTCPVCGADLEEDDWKAEHISTHSPSDFGLDRDRIDLTPPTDGILVAGRSPSSHDRR